MVGTRDPVAVHDPRIAAHVDAGSGPPARSIHLPWCGRARGARQAGTPDRPRADIARQRHRMPYPFRRDASRSQREPAQQCAPIRQVPRTTPEARARSPLGRCGANTMLYSIAGCPPRRRLKPAAPALKFSRHPRSMQRRYGRPSPGGTGPPCSAGRCRSPRSGRRSDCLAEQPTTVDRRPHHRGSPRTRAGRPMPRAQESFAIHGIGPRILADVEQCIQLGDAQVIVITDAIVGRMPQRCLVQQRQVAAQVAMPRWQVRQPVVQITCRLATGGNRVHAARPASRRYRMR